MGLIRLPIAKISEHTNRPEFIDLLKRSLGINYRVFQELILENRDQEDIVIFSSDKVKVIDNQSVEWPRTYGAVAVIETKKHDVDGLDHFKKDLLRYLKKFNSKLGFITNYSKVIEYSLDSNDNLELRDMSIYESTDDLIDSIVTSVYNKAKKAIYRKPNQIMKMLEEYIEILIRYTRKVDHKDWERILSLSDSKEHKKIEILNKEEKKKLEERKKLIWRTAAYIAVAQIFFYIVFRLYRVENQINVNPELFPLSSSNGVPSNIQEILETIPENNLNFKAILGKDKLIFSILDDDSSEVLNDIIKSLEGVSVSFVIENDLIGQIFQRCLPNKIRKRFAAYYTKIEAAQLLCKLSIAEKDTLVFDPACGSGTLLVSSYHRKKFLGLNNHKELLKQIKGGDISTIATMMSTINLAIQDPSKWTNEVKLYRGDAFELMWGVLSFFDVEIHSADGVTSEDSKIMNEGIGTDLIIGNPPFTFGIRLTKEERAYLTINVEKRFNIRLDFGRLGLYAPFLFLAADFQRKKKNGRISYILPHSSISSPAMSSVWEKIFDLGYGMEFLIEASSKDVSFSDSDSHEIMVLLKKGYTKDATFIQLSVSLEDVHIDDLANFIRNKEPNNLFEITNYSQEFLRKNPCHLWSVTPDLTLQLLFKNFKTFNFFKDDIIVIPEHQYKPADYWLLPNKYWTISDYKEKSIEITATERNTAALDKKSGIPNKLNLPKINLQPILNNLLENYRDVPIIIPSELTEFQKRNIQKYFILDEKAKGFKKYNEWGKLARSKEILGKTWTSGKINENVEIGLIRQINYDNSKMLAMRIKLPIPLSRIFMFGMKFVKEEFADLFFSYLTSSIFYYYAVSKSRRRSGSYSKIEKADFIKYYRFPDFIELLKDEEKSSNLIKLSEGFNSNINLSGRLKIYKQVEKARSDRDYGLRKLDEAWFEALDIPLSMMDHFYDGLLEKFYRLINK